MERTQTKEHKTVISLASIMAFRMLGLFMILPVFAIGAKNLQNANATLVGIALGIYGLTQALLQLPFSALSDRIGRKPIITVGLILFAVGSIVAALSSSIYGVIVGRALQGAGAIGSTTLALVADLTRDEGRSKAMAVMGLTIGFSFALAMVIGPMINAWFQLSGIFWSTAILAVIGLILLFFAVPNPPKVILHTNTEMDVGRFIPTLKNSQLLRLNLGIFSLHAILTAMFIAIPIALTHVALLPEIQQALLYLSVLALSFIAAFPLIIVSEKKHCVKQIFIGAIVLIFLTEVLLTVLHQSLFEIGALLFLFFTAFTLLEANLPSLISKISPIRNKGTALGIYSTSQFFGIFVGGALGGWIFSAFEIHGLFIFCASLSIVWLIIAYSMKQPPYLTTLILSLPDNNDISNLPHSLRNLSGVMEVAIMPEENLVYLKVDKKLINEPELRNLIKQSNFGQ